MIFKHSTRCPLSRTAKEEVENALKHFSSQAIDYELIDVITERPRSNQVAEQWGIVHESPQLIILNESGQVLWTASHRRITVENILAALSDR